MPDADANDDAWEDFVGWHVENDLSDCKLAKLLCGLERARWASGLAGDEACE
jgi:hypothetical protein